MLIAIDHGNKQIKTIHKIFTSGVRRSDTRPICEDFMEYEGVYYSLTNQRIPFIWDKSSSEDFFILTLFAIAYEIEARDEYSKDEINDVDLAVGLPPAHYGSLKKRFEDYFRRTKDEDYIEFSFRDKPFYITIHDVLAFPQAYAAALTVLARFQGISKIYVVDIGGMTADYLQIQENQQLDTACCGSFEHGVITLYNEIQSKIRGDYGMLVDDAQIDALLRGEDVLDNPHIMEIVDNGAQSFVASLLGRLRENQMDLRTATTIFVGGGSILLRKYIEPSEAVGRCVFVEDICANIKGYELLYRISKLGAGS